jgi:hypothetical protein
MRPHQSVPLAFTVLFSSLIAAQSSAEPQPDPQAVLADCRDRLTKSFDSYLEEPGAYARRVERARGAFPEGDLFPFIYPALAYVNLSRRDPARVGVLCRACAEIE